MKRIGFILAVLCLCGVAQAQVGIYRSSGYGAIQKEKVKREKKPLPTAMIGLSAGGGVTASKHVLYPNGAVGFDFAISATPKFAMGMYTQWGVLENFSFGLQFVGGDFMHQRAAFVGGFGFAMNMKGTRYYQYPAISILDGYYNSVPHYTNAYHYTTETFSVGGQTVTRTIAYSNASFGPALRIGFITPKHFYMLFDASIFPRMYLGIVDRYQPANHPWYGVESPAETAVTATVSVGYAFGINPKRNKQINQE